MPTPAASPYYDLGTFSRPVSTTSAEAQSWFDRGLIWSYGFNHDEAVRCFERALEFDSGLAMAHWGIAYAVGPNYNKDWDAFDAEERRSALRLAHSSATRALELAATAAPVEQLLIQAIVQRFPSAQQPADFGEWKQAYADAMRVAYDAFPNDLDVVTLHADALMNLTAWQLWDVATGEPAEGASTLEIKRVLDLGLGLPGAVEHPGVLHLYLHLMEMSAHPEEALPAANALRGLVPDAGHLVHMPTHIDVLTGDYARVIEGNTRAIAADDRYAEREGSLGFYALYHAHDHHFRIYGAMFAAQEQTALAAASALENLITDDLLRVESPPMADWLESFYPMRVHVFVRFGRWQELIEMPLPTDAALYAVTTAMLHYGKGVALSALGRVDEADVSRDAFRAALELVPESRYLFNNTARDILQVASAMLDGEIAYRRGEFETAFEHLRRAVLLDDTLPYDEPWGWMQPTRHAYGALLLEQGEVALAEAVYAADLGFDGTLGRACQHPNNVWSLHGYHECLVRLGRLDEAAAIKQRLDQANGIADVAVTASCACRMGTAA